MELGSEPGSVNIFSPTTPALRERERRIKRKLPWRHDTPSVLDVLASFLVAIGLAGHLSTSAAWFNYDYLFVNATNPTIQHPAASIPVILAFESLVCVGLFAIASFVPWTQQAKFDQGLQWTKWFGYAIGAGLFFAVGNSLWFYSLGRLSGNTKILIHTNLFSCVSRCCLWNVVFLGHVSALYAQASLLVM
jgi:hypothetical protein